MGDFYSGTKDKGTRKKKFFMVMLTIRVYPLPPPGCMAKVHGSKVHKAPARAFEYFQVFRLQECE